MHAIGSLIFQVISHPPYSPDIAPCDSFFFKLKEHLKDTKFDSDEKIKVEVKVWFAAAQDEFYLDGITELVKHCQKHIDLKGSCKITTCK